MSSAMSGDLQLGPCRIEVATRKLLRVYGGGDQPAIVAAIHAAGGVLDGSKRCWWVEARRLGTLARGLRRASDPLFGPSGIESGPAVRD